MVPIPTPPGGWGRHRADVADRLPPPMFPSKRPRQSADDGRTSGPGPEARGSIEESRVAGPRGEEPSPDRPGEADPFPDEPAGLPEAAPPGRDGGDAEGLDEMFISPDDPIPPRSTRDAGGTMVTGIDNDPHLEFGAEAEPPTPVPDPTLWWEAPGVADLIAVLEKLVKDLRHGGLEGMTDSPGMNSAERTLRAYCLGYLSAQAEDQ